MTQEPEQQPAEQRSDQPVAKAAEKRKKSAVREWLETIAVALVVALLIRGFVVQVYLVDGASMEPSLHTGERLFVNKFIYRFRDPQPGEIIVLQDPGTPNRELIKRIIAVEGETVEIRNGITFIDGKPLKEEFVNKERLESINMDPVKVPGGHVFVMGDNRAYSHDSRRIGSVDESKIDGVAFFLYWPLNRFAVGPLKQTRQYLEAGAVK